MTRGLGWKRDAVDQRDLRFSAHVGGTVPDGPLSLLEYRSRGWDQDGVSACVGFALARALHVSMLASHSEGAPEPSPMFLYYNARAQEFAGQSPAPVEDGGSYPRLAMTALRNLGLCKESAWPFDPETRNQRPPLRCYRAAYDQKDAVYYRIDSDGPMRVLELRLALSKGYPVIFGLPVDRAFTEHVGPQAIDAISGEILGGHMLCALASDEGEIVFCNSWGPSWGFSDGLGTMTDELFGSAMIGDVYAIEAARVAT